MSLYRLVYVACNKCHTPCGGDEGMGDRAAEARQYAKAMGWVRVGKRDLCPSCQRAEGLL